MAISDASKSDLKPSVTKEQLDDASPVLKGSQGSDPKINKMLSVN